MSAEQPDIHVGRALILDSEGQLAIAQRSAQSKRNSLVFEFPGGQFDQSLDTTILDTAVREPREEIGLHIRLLSRDPVYSTTRRFIDRNQHLRQIRTDFFGAVALNTEFNPDPTEIEAAFWRWPTEIGTIADLTIESRTALGAFGAAALLPKYRQL